MKKSERRTNHARSSSLRPARRPLRRARDARIIEPTDAVIRISATCVCGSDLWPYRGFSRSSGPTPMGHEYCGIVEEVGSAVKSVKPGSSSSARSRRPTTPVPTAEYGYQSSCEHREFISTGHRRRCCACRWRTGRWCRRRTCRRTTWSRACWRARTSWAPAGLPPTRPT